MLGLARLSVLFRLAFQPRFLAPLNCWSRFETSSIENLWVTPDIDFEVKLSEIVRSLPEIVRFALKIQVNTGAMRRNLTVSTSSGCRFIVGIKHEKEI